MWLGDGSAQRRSTGSRRPEADRGGVECVVRIVAPVAQFTHLRAGPHKVVAVTLRATPSVIPEIVAPPGR